MTKSKQSATSSKPKRINGAKKGKQFERDVANALGHIFPNAERMLEYQASGNIGVDIKGTGCFKIQCKRNANYAPIGKIHEVRTEDPNDIPILVTKGNHLAPMAVLPFEALIRMLEVMHGMTPLLRKPEDTSTKAIEDKSVHVPQISTKSVLLGYPIVEDEILSLGEVSTESLLRGHENFRLVNFGDKSLTPKGNLIKHIDQCILMGHVIKSIHCHSEKDLFDMMEEIVYPVLTSEITSLSELI